jgi:parallel beta-helix repeat protein
MIPTKPLLFRSTLTNPIRAIALLTCSFLFAFLASQPAYAQGTPTVTYTPGNNLITIGSAAGATPGSQVISLAQVAAAVSGAGAPDRVVNQNGVWQLNARILVQSTARLEITAGGVNELRLNSAVGSIVYIQVVRGGQLLIDGVKVVSWENNAVDETIGNGRAYIVAQEGARMDILRSDLGYLGDALGGAASSGVAWVKRGSDLDPMTGSTGQVEDSKFHHNFQGLFVSEGIQLAIRRNEVYNNLNHGIFLRDGTQQSEVSANIVHDNGNKNATPPVIGNGIFLDNNIVQITVRDNKIYANANYGILLARKSNGNTIAGNESYQNSDGIAIDESDNNVIQSNRSYKNQNGILVSGAPTDPASGNQIIGNTVEDSASTNGTAYGIYLYNHADNNWTFEKR